MQRKVLWTVWMGSAAVWGCDGSDEKGEDSADCQLAPELCGDGGGSGATQDSDDSDDSDGGGSSGGPDSGGPDSGWSDEGGGSGGSVGFLEGESLVYIVETGCDIVWDMYGDQCPGCDLGWDVEMDLTSRGSCSFGGDYPGRFEVVSGSAYFDGDYWGAASHGGGTVTWATAGYVYGADGYTYFYGGSATYDGTGGTGGSGGSGSTGGDTDVDPISGTAGVYIVETDCDVIWDISGPQCPGCDLGWDIDMRLSGSGSCPFGDDFSGTFEVVDGAAYFRGDYWGAASAVGGNVSWATAGYVYGAAGYTYAYAGSATY